MRSPVLTPALGIPMLGLRCQRQIVTPPGDRLTDHLLILTEAIAARRVHARHSAVGGPPIPGWVTVKPVRPNIMIARSYMWNPSPIIRSRSGYAPFRC